MSSFHKNNDEALGDTLRERFWDFEPEAPELSPALWDQVQPEHVNYTLPVVKSIGVLLLSLFFSPLSPYETYDRPATSTAVPVLNGSDIVSLPVETKEARQSKSIINTNKAKINDGETVRVVRNRSIPSEIEDKSMNLGLAARPTSLLSDEAIPFSEELKLLTPPAPKPLPFPSTESLGGDNPQRENVSTRKRSKLSFTGGIGLTNTQSVVTLLPQNAINIQDMKLPGFWESVNWKPQAFVGVDYANWQLQLNYREFSQQMEYWVTEGALEVDYQGNEIRSIRAIGSNEIISRNTRQLGLSIRKAILLKSLNTYMGVGGGYQVSLGPDKSKTPWAQLFTGRTIPISDKTQLFVEGQFNFSFQSIVHPQHQIYAKPYQIGLSTGLRWKKW
jgi:hypothetical protein